MNQKNLPTHMWKKLNQNSYSFQIGHGFSLKKLSIIFHVFVFMYLIYQNFAAVVHFKIKL